MKCFLFEDDMTTLFVRPKEQAWTEEDQVEVPRGIIERYKAVTEEFYAVQKLLRPYWEEK